MNNYLSINDKINIIYNFIYKKNKKNSNINTNIDIKKITLDDIKISISDKEYYNIIKNDIFTASFKFICYKYDYILLKRYSNNLNLIVKIYFYENNSNINNIKYSINNDNLFSYLLSNFVLLDKTHNILLPIINFDIEFKYLYNIIPEEIRNIIIKKYNNDNLICCIQLREYFYKVYTFTEYLQLQKNCINIKNILFQIIYTLAIINIEYPYFKHNNLVFNNILIYENNNTTYKGFKNDTFILNTNIDLKIFNFDKATITKNNNNNNDLLLLYNELKKYNFCDNETNIFIKKKYSDYISMLYA
jgi:hypothetical protein